MDAKFNQRHSIAVGDSPWSSSKRRSTLWASASQQHGKPLPGTVVSSQVPDSADDECEKSCEAADEKKAKLQANR